MEPREPLSDAGDVPAADRERVSRNLSVLQAAVVIGALLGALADVATGNMPGAVILFVGSVLAAVSAWLRRRGWLQLSAVVFLTFMVTMIHLLCTIGEGVHDTAAILYPVAILSAALMLNRGLLVTVTVSCVASVAILVYQERSGPSGWPDVFDIAIILAVTAVAVYRLVRDVVGSVAEARSKERRLAQAYETLKARTAELERFTYVVSHDLRSPLVTIRGFLDYVEQAGRDGDVARMEKDATCIRVASDRMGDLLDDLLVLSRTGRIESADEDLAFGALVEESRALVEGRLMAGGVRLSVAEDAARRMVRGDRARLVQLLQNLLESAAKFSAGQAAPEIVVGVRDGSDPVFTVNDNGVGIDSADQADVFELFHQIDPTQEGTGLGLALGRRIVETHGGRLWVESEGQGRGATFCFTLPTGTAVP